MLDAAPAAQAVPTVWQELRRRFDLFGAVRLRGLLDRSEVQGLLASLRRLSGLDDAAAADVMARRRAPFVAPSAVHRTPHLRPLIVHSRLVGALRALLGQDIRFLYGDSAFVHFSGTAWHRDTPFDPESAGPAWDPAFETFRQARVLLFLHEHRKARFAVRPGTHRLPAQPLAPDGVVAEDPSQMALWFDVGPGDAVVFDARLLHRGEEVQGPRYGITLTFGPADRYNVASHFHARILRPDQGLGPPDDELRELLRSRDLLLEEGLDPTCLAHYENLWRGVPRGPGNRVALNPYV